MRRRVLRVVLGLGYILLLTIMLLYQAGAFGGRRNWVFASIGTLALGVALAVVFVLYMRVKDETVQKSTVGKAIQKGVENRSYEEIYADFLCACEGRGLSERELEVAWLLYRGRTNRQIGEELFIAETTVKKHVTHIYQKLEVYSRKDFRAMVQDKAGSRLRSDG